MVFVHSRKDTGKTAEKLVICNFISHNFVKVLLAYWMNNFEFIFFT